MNFTYNRQTIGNLNNLGRNLHYLEMMHCSYMNLRWHPALPNYWNCSRLDWQQIPQPLQIFEEHCNMW